VPAFAAGTHFAGTAVALGSGGQGGTAVRLVNAHPPLVSTHLG
jgi:hypothetical protein